MKYFYDTEFIESGPEHPIELLSIGVVCEDGRELYLQNLDCTIENANEWVVQNVFPHLQELNYSELSPGVINVFEPNTNAEVWAYKEGIVRQLIEFVTGPDIQIWGYYADYDHVVLCQLFGAMVNLPDGWPMYTRDLKQLCDQLGNPKLPEQGKNEHHALLDARWNKQVYDFLMARESRPDFVVKAYDENAPAMVLLWLDLACQSDVQSEKRKKAMAHYERIVAWQEANPDQVKKPD